MKHFTTKKQQQQNQQQPQNKAATPPPPSEIFGAGLKDQIKCNTAYKTGTIYFIRL